MSAHTDPFIAETQAWVAHAVVGLDLCPFAASVMAKNQIRYLTTLATQPSELLEVLRDELNFLAHADAREVETTLLIHPQVLQGFLEYNEFLGAAEQLVEELGYSGTLQVASFHPQYQFADTTPDDVTNATNQSPYPTLHLLREESIARGLEHFPNPEAIYQANQVTLQKLGREGWAALRSLCRRNATDRSASTPGSADQS